MNRSLALPFLLALVLAGLASQAPAAVSEEPDAAAAGDAPDERQVPDMRQRSYRLLAEAQHLIEREENAAGEQLLQEALAEGWLNPYETAQVWNMIAYSRYAAGDIKGSIAAYQQVLAQQPISRDLEQESLRTLAQLQYGNDDFAGALATVERWLALQPGPEPVMHFIKAMALYERGDVEGALPAALDTLAAAERSGEAVLEPWLHLLLVLHNQRGDAGEQIKVLERLLVLFPRKRYWLHLGGLYTELGQDAQALSAFYAPYAMGLFDTELEFLMLAQRLMLAGVPHEAVTVLEKGFKDGMVQRSADNLALQADAMTLARDMEAAITVREEIARQAQHGEALYRYGQALANGNRHEEAVAVYRRALARPELPNPLDVTYWLGLSLLQLERWEEALDAFRLAAGDARRAPQIRGYVDYAKAEMRRREAIRALERN